MYGGSLPIGRYCQEALQSLGHSVRVFEAPIFYSTFTGLKNLDLSPEQIFPLERSFLQIVGQAIWAQTESFEPHLLLAMAQAPVSKPILARMRKAGVRTVMWFVEDYQLFQYWQLYAPLYDVFAVIQKEPFLTELARIGQNRVLYLPLAALPKFHHKITLSPAEEQIYGADIGFLGAGYPNRRLAFRSLAGKNFKIWGSDWDGEQILAANIQREGQRISSEESVKIYNASKINLNLHSSIKVDQLISGGDFVNPRTFELAAMEAFQLVDKRSLLPELFEADELATFASVDELYRKIEFYLHHPAERCEIVAKAYKKVLAEHTYQHRMETLLGYVEDTLGFNKFHADLDAQNTTGDFGEYDAAIQNLLTELNAGPNATFEEVVARLRRQTGHLTELETSILFLDEFRKQYLGN
ncbi:MAG: glycosyltransferase [Desulfovibrionaceae bacterium]|nr:glycosyltransferase [Desulfovibrionaceae bacterium]